MDPTQYFAVISRTSAGQQALVCFLKPIVLSQCMLISDYCGNVEKVQCIIYLIHVIGIYNCMGNPSATVHGYTCFLHATSPSSPTENIQ